jgi:hypothetical protein
MSKRNISWGVEGGYGVRCVGLTNLPRLFNICLEFRGPQPAGNFWVCNRHFAATVLLLVTHDVYL